MSSMKLEYLGVIDEYDDEIIRLYDFDSREAIKFRSVIHSALLDKKHELDLGSVDFITPLNCSLKLRISAEDIGITSADKQHFYCDLTYAGYQQMVELLVPFCEDSRGYQWLYNLDNPIEFLFSPGGWW